METPGRDLASTWRRLTSGLLFGVGFVAAAGGLAWSAIEGWSGSSVAALVAGGVAWLAVFALNVRFLFRTPAGRAAWNAGLSIGLVLIAFGLLSYLNYHEVAGSVDWTEDRRFTLSESTRSLVARLEKDVILTVVQSPESRSDLELKLNADITDLVERYTVASRGHVRYRVWGAVQDEDRIFRLLQELSFDAADFTFPSVIVQCGQASRHLEPRDFQIGGDAGELLFRGEEALTNAILEVTATEKPRVYFTRGHEEGEIDLFALRGFTRFRAAIRRGYLDTANLNLEKARAVPDDCAALVVLGPRRDFTRLERIALEAYLQRGGRLLVLLESAIEVWEEPAQLRGLFRPWGLDVMGGVVFDRGSCYQGNPSWVWLDRYGGHAVVNPLEERPVVLLLPRGIALTEPSPGDGRQSPRGRAVRTDVLMRSSTSSWCETDPRPPERPEDLGPGKGDVRGPIVLGVAIQESGDRASSSPGARLVVLGDASFLSNRNLERFPFCAHTHLDLALNALHWLLEREVMVSISARRFLGYRYLTPLDVSDRSIRAIFWGGMMGMPLLVLLAGIVVWYVRRR